MCGLCNIYAKKSQPRSQCISAVYPLLHTIGWERNEMGIRLVKDCDMVLLFSLCLVFIVTLTEYLRNPLFQDIVLYCGLHDCRGQVSRKTSCTKCHSYQLNRDTDHMVPSALQQSRD